VSVLRTVKSRRGKLVKYKAINELVRVGAITPMNWYAITPMNWYAITPMNWYAWGRVGACQVQERLLVHH
jgi:hypothetical protein